MSTAVNAISTPISPPITAAATTSTPAGRKRRASARQAPGGPAGGRGGSVVGILGGFEPAAVGQLEHVGSAREAHVEVVRGLEVQPAAVLEAERLVEAHGGLGVADADAGV